MTFCLFLIFSFLRPLQNVYLPQHCLDPTWPLLPLLSWTFDVLSGGRFCFCSLLFMNMYLPYSSPSEGDWGPLHMGPSLPLSKSLTHEGEVPYLTAHVINNLQNIFTAVPAANQHPPSLKSITYLPGDCALQGHHCPQKP